MNYAELMPGETELERTKAALAQAALLVAFEAGGIDPTVLYDVRGSTLEARWRHVWLYLVRNALNIREADIKRALTRVLIDMGLRVEPGSEPEPGPEPKRQRGESEKDFRERQQAFKTAHSEWRVRNSGVHHDTVANACHHIEDLRAFPGAEEEIARMGEELVEKFTNHRRRNAAMNEAWDQLTESRKRERKAAS